MKRMKPSATHAHGRRGRPFCGAQNRGRGGLIWIPVIESKGEMTKSFVEKRRWKDTRKRIISK